MDVREYLTADGTNPYREWLDTLDVTPRAELTAGGLDIADRLAAARRARLAELFAEWSPDRHEELAALLDRIARELVPERARTA